MKLILPKSRKTIYPKLLSLIHPVHTRYSLSACTKKIYDFMNFHDGNVGYFAEVMQEWKGERTSTMINYIMYVPKYVYYLI